VTVLPGRRLANVTDVLRWGAILTARGRAGLPWPNQRVLGPSTAWLGERFVIVSDETRSFTYAIDGPDDAERLIGALYLPGVSDERRRRAVRVVDGWIGGRIGLLLRRIVARARP
jgi:hypothetical protein